MHSLPDPFVDWTIDDNGTIHTASGYRCTPQIIEAALWLFAFGQHTFGGKLMFSADDRKKRSIYSIDDIRVTRLQRADENDNAPGHVDLTAL
jgi:hypothetical protein